MAGKRTFGLALVVAAILIVGLAGGLAVDQVFGTRPLGTAVLALSAGQVALFLVYRSLAGSFRRIGRGEDP